MSEPSSADACAALNKQPPPVRTPGVGMSAGMVVAAADMFPATTVASTACVGSGGGPYQALANTPSDLAPAPHPGVLAPGSSRPHASLSAVEAQSAGARDQGQTATISGQTPPTHSAGHHLSSSSSQPPLPYVSSSGGGIRRSPLIASPFSLAMGSSHSTQLLRAPSAGLPSPLTSSLSLAHSGSRALSSSVLSTTMSMSASGARSSPAGPMTSSSGSSAISSSSSPGPAQQAVRAYHWSPQKRACSVFFARVPPSVGSEEVEAVFATAGRVMEVQLYRTFVKCRVSKGCGVVCYETPQDAQNAIDTLNGRSIWSHARHPLYVTCIKTAEQLPTTAGPQDVPTSSSSSSSSKPAGAVRAASSSSGHGGHGGSGELLTAVSALLQQMNLSRTGGYAAPADAMERAGSDQQPQLPLRLPSYMALQPGRGTALAPAAAPTGSASHQQQDHLLLHHHHLQQQQQQQLVWVPVALGAPPPAGGAAAAPPMDLASIQQQLAWQQPPLAMQQQHVGQQGVPGLQLHLSPLSQHVAQGGPTGQAAPPAGLGLQQQALSHQQVQRVHSPPVLPAQQAHRHDGGLADSLVAAAAAAGGPGTSGSLPSFVQLPGGAVGSSGVATAAGPGGVFSSSPGLGPMRLVPMMGQMQEVWATQHAPAMQSHAEGALQYQQQQQQLMYTSVPAAVGVGAGLAPAAGTQLGGYLPMQQQVPLQPWPPAVHRAEASGQVLLSPSPPLLPGVNMMLQGAPTWTGGEPGDLSSIVPVVQQQQQQQHHQQQQQTMTGMQVTSQMWLPDYGT